MNSARVREEIQASIDVKCAILRDESAVQAIVDIYRSLQSLTDEERRTVEKNARYEEYLGTLDKAGEKNHFDAASGVTAKSESQQGRKPHQNGSPA